MRQQRKLVVVSCSRSGTLFTVKLLNSLGVKVEHERVGRDGGVGWNMLLPQNFGPYRWGTIVHQVRNPLKVIASCLTHTDNLWKRVASYIGPLPKNKLLRCLYYYVRWNRLCEKYSDVRIRVERLVPGTDSWTSLMGAAILPSIVVPPDMPATNTNTRKHDEVSMADLARWPGLSRELRQMADTYGYKL